MSMLRNVLLLAGVCGGCLAAWKVSAVDCVESDCAALGYSQSVGDCEGEKILCPFDKTKAICKGKPKTKICDTVGDVLLDNRLCAVDPFDVDSDRVPIGIVYDVENRKAGATLQQDAVMWCSNTPDDVLVRNSCSEEYLDIYVTGEQKTAKKIAWCEENNEDCGIYRVANEYVTDGTRAGDWYIPEIGELVQLYKAYKNLCDGETRCTSDSFLSKFEPVTAYRLIPTSTAVSTLIQNQMMCAMQSGRAVSTSCGSIYKGWYYLSINY